MQCRCNGQALLLRRSPTSGNPNTLGLPGGNQDAQDNADLMQTAIREAIEEMGSPLPQFSVVKSFLIKRGKRLQKHFTVFLAMVTPEAKEAWGGPHALDVTEHTGYAWVSVEELAGGVGGEMTAQGLELHPVVRRLLVDEPVRTQVLFFANNS